MQVMEYNERVEFIPERDISELRGFVKGINTSLVREADRVWMWSIPAAGWSTSQTGLTRRTLLRHCEMRTS